MDTFSKATGIVIFILLLFLFPMLYQTQRYDAIAQSYVEGIVDDFVNNIQNSGELKAETYTKFIADLNKTGNIYDVDLTCTTYSDSGSSPVKNETKHSDIMDKLYTQTGTEGKIHFPSGSYINIVVSNKNRTLNNKLQQVLYSTIIEGKAILVTNGGVVQ